MFDYATLLHCATAGAATPANKEIDQKELKGESLTFMFKTPKAAIGAVIEESNDNTTWSVVGTKDLVQFKKNVGYIGSKRYVRSKVEAVVIVTKTGFVPSDDLPTIFDALQIDASTVEIEFDSRVSVAQKNRVGQFFKICQFDAEKYHLVDSVSVSEDGLKITAKLAEAMENAKTYKVVLVNGAVKDSHGRLNLAHTFFIRKPVGKK